MRLNRRVSLEGVHLDSLDSRILITGVEESAGRDNVNGISYGFGDGQRVTGQRRDTLDVTVKFTLAVKPGDMTERSDVLEKICAWAVNGGILKTSARGSDRRLRVLCAQLPAGGDKYKFDSEYTIVFRAFTVPYWQNDKALEVSPKKEGASRTVSMDVPGTVPTPAAITITNKSGAKINTITVTAGSSVMTFAGLGLAADEKLVIDHVNSGKEFYLRIRKGGSTMVSAMAYRSTDSANDLWCGPGHVSFSVIAQRAVTYTVSVRGRFA